MEQLILNAIKSYGFKKAMGMFAKDDFDAAVGEMTGGGIRGNSFTNMFTGGEGIAGLIKNQTKKFAMNKLMGGSGGIGGIGGMALPLVGGLALGYMTNPLREGSYNYNPELQGQIDYASEQGLIDRNNSAGILRYNEDSVLSGQNVISGFGTNDYGKQLQKYRDKYADTMPSERLEQLDREIQDQITDDFDKVDAYMETIAPAAPAPAPVYTPRDEGGGGGGGNPTGSPGSKGPGGSDEMGSFARGGIAGINRNRGQLGEILYG